MMKVDLVVIGGGPAGMAAALEARRNGIEDILILERDRELGGILQQCIHNGFGLHYFGEELTGPEYAGRFIKQIEEQGIKYKLNTMVLDISHDKVVTAVNSSDGLLSIKAGAVILSMGCRERSRGALNIPGSRPSGIFTAGTAQRFVNMEGYLPGRKIVILGSGDIGLIMARRLTLEGAEVKMVCELLPYSGGLTRNIVQCLEDYNIPLRLSHTVVDVHGRERLEGVTVAAVDERRRPIKGTEEYVECDTLLLSVGLIPENELTKAAGIPIDLHSSGPSVDESMETNASGIFACGNVVHVHDLVDYVTEESIRAGKSAAHYILGKRLADAAGKTEELTEYKITEKTEEKTEFTLTIPGSGVRYIVPQRIDRNSGVNEVKLFFRVTSVFRNINIIVKDGNEILYTTKRVRSVPGEMEIITLKSDVLEEVRKRDSVTVCIQLIQEGNEHGA